MEKNEAKIKFLEIPFGMDSCPVRKKFDRRLHRKSTIVERLCFFTPTLYMYRPIFEA